LTSAAAMAFMAQDGWKSGLTAGQLTKVEALQTDNERLQKEASQKKLMLENVEQELEKQKRKVRNGDLRLTFAAQFCSPVLTWSHGINLIPVCHECEREYFLFSYGGRQWTRNREREVEISC
jgi:hypothetical protein